jgi:hypothetical protein
MFSMPGRTAASVRVGAQAAQSSFKNRRTSGMLLAPDGTEQRGA